MKNSMGMTCGRLSLLMSLVTIRSPCVSIRYVSVPPAVFRSGGGDRCSCISVFVPLSSVAVVSFSCFISADGPWVLECLFMANWVLNFLAQWAHCHDPGVSWILFMCFCKMFPVLNPLLQYEHLNNLAFSWTAMCSFKAVCDLHILWHSSHSMRFKPN